MIARLSAHVHKFIIITALVAAVRPEAVVRYVDINNVTPAPPYTSWLTAATNIQNAVNLSADGDTVLVAQGVYLLKGGIVVTNNISIIGAGNPEQTIIDGGHNGRGFHLGETFSVIGGFTIRNGIGFSGEGGGIYCDNRSPSIFNCLIEDNQSGGGGGIKSGTAYNCLFINNSADQWGGGGMSGGIAYDCLFVENDASKGGGLLFSDAFSCTMVSNTADSGGGMYAGSASNCTFNGNQSMFGGGMAFGAAFDCVVRQNQVHPSGFFVGGEGGGLYEVDAINLLLDDNYAYWLGGGMYGGSALSCIITNNGADEGGGVFGSTVLNCLVVKNMADHGGGMNGGIAVNSTIYDNGGWLGVEGARFVTASNCIIQGSELYSGTTGSSYFHCCSPDATHGVDGNITNAPSFMNSGQDYRLSFDSPCIDAGDNSILIWPSDLEGNARIINSRVDLGAYEYNPILRDSDSDGITDEWELLYFASATGCVATGHADIDGCDNLEEYIAGTDPTNSGSFFQATQAYPIEAGFVLEWNAVSNRLYSIDWTPQLMGAFQPLESGIPYPQASYTDTVHTTDDVIFYSLKVIRD
ncbi:choice-of-anchor Q domain-containing protein [Pontiellaceae bacterium B12227]|nr:choice-of-anchor Q domain-containing protein [Pontiellaceae bacterium B12227]